MADGWPIFAEWDRLKALPHYGGNNIPNSYLKKFNAATKAWLVKIGARQPEQALPESIPAHIAEFASEL